MTAVYILGGVIVLLAIIALVFKAKLDVAQDEASAAKAGEAVAKLDGETTELNQQLAEQSKDRQVEQSNTEVKEKRELTKEEMEKFLSGIGSGKSPS
jgi:phytoene/squalene synthetase